MFRYLSVLLLILSFSASADSIKFDIDGAKLSAVVKVIYQEAFTDKSFALDAAVLSDERPVVFRYTDTKKGFRPFFVSYLSSLGYTLENVGGVDLITKKQKYERFEGDDIETVFYRPKYRNPTDLISMLSPMFNGRFMGAQAFTDTELKVDSVVTDSLLFAGSRKESAVLRSLLEKIDFPVAQVEVKSVLYEVAASSSEGSALRLVGSLLSGRLSVDFGGQSLKNSLTLKLADIDAVVSALSTDDRFKVLSSPSVRVNSGRQASFTVGEDVPVLGAVSYPQGSNQPVQSVEYRSSGVIFSVLPNVRDSVIDLDVNQQISSFIQTTSGVNSSPTLNKRELKTSVSINDGDVIVIGGLKQQKDVNGKSGVSFLPFLDSKKIESNESEILLFIQATRI